MLNRTLVVQSRTLLAWIVGPLAFCSGCAMLPGEAVQRIEDAGKHYSANRYNDARRLLDQVITDYPQTKGVAKAYYVRGMCHYRERQDEQARSDFQKVLQTAAGPGLKAKASAQLGHICYQRKEFRSASKYYTQAANADPDTPFMDEVYYRYGDSLQKIGKWEAARKVLPKTWRLFPSSDLAAYARLKFAWRHEYFSIQCGAFNRSDLAHEFANNLRQKGFNAATEVNVRGDEAKHVVHIGRYANFMEAESDLAHVRQVVADAYVVP